MLHHWRIDRCNNHRWEGGATWNFQRRSGCRAVITLTHLVHVVASWKFISCHVIVTKGTTAKCRNPKKKLVHIAVWKKVVKQIERHRHQRGRCPGKKIGPSKQNYSEKAARCGLMTDANMRIVGADCSMWNLMKVMKLVSSVLRRRTPHPVRHGRVVLMARRLGSATIAGPWGIRLGVPAYQIAYA
jgi:hypothetical protein